MQLFTFPPNSMFWITNLQIHVVQNVPTDHTDHFRFHHFFDFDICFQSKSNFLENFTFSTFCKKGRFHREPVFLKASGCRVDVGLRRLFFGKFTFFEFLDMSIFSKSAFSRFLMIFPKMAPQAKPLCPYERYRNSVQNPGTDVPRCPIWVQFHRDKLQI